MKRQIRFLAAIFLVVVISLINSGCVVHQSNGVIGLVLDSKTGKPVQGAAVVVVHYETEGTLGGSSHYPESATEMTTDSEGKFILPKKLIWGLGAPENSHRIYLFEPNYEFVDIKSDEFLKNEQEPDFKRSYATNGNLYRADGSLIISSVETNKEKIFNFRLSRLETESQKKKNVDDVFIWEQGAVMKQFPNFMGIVNSERHKYGQIGRAHV